MNILLAFDSFKDALSAPEVCQAVARGLLRADPSLQPRLFPLADGGEGTAEILGFHSGGQWIPVQVADPLGRPIEAGYGWSAREQTAFVEMAQASGLPLLKPEERNPLLTNTFGTGQLIADALRRGARKIIMGIGGSATNDAGLGMAAALGYRFFDKQGKEQAPNGQNLSFIDHLLPPQGGDPLSGVEVEVLCDVDNPLYGPEGAAQVYAPQKGADAEAVQQLDAGLRQAGRLLENYFGRSFAQIPGAGAAGGLGAGAMAFLGARLRPGIDAVMDFCRFDEALAESVLVLSGEGRLDGQTRRGKLLRGICRRAETFGVPVIALCGAVEAGPEDIEEIGLCAAFSILNRPLDLATALAETEKLLEMNAFQVARTWLCTKKHS